MSIYYFINGKRAKSFRIFLDSGINHNLGNDLQWRIESNSRFCLSRLFLSNLSFSRLFLRRLFLSRLFLNMLRSWLGFWSQLRLTLFNQFFWLFLWLLRCIYRSMEQIQNLLDILMVVWLFLYIQSLLLLMFIIDNQCAHYLLLGLHYTLV